MNKKSAAKANIRSKLAEAKNIKVEIDRMRKVLRDLNKKRNALTTEVITIMNDNEIEKVEFDGKEYKATDNITYARKTDQKKKEGIRDYLYKKGIYGLEADEMCDDLGGIIKGREKIKKKLDNH